MKKLIFIFALIVSMSTFAQTQGIPCSTCGPDEVTVNVTIDTSIIEGQIDYGNGLSYQSNQMQAQQFRTQQDMLAEMKLQTKYQKQTRNAARVGAVAGVAGVLVEGAGLVVDIKTLDALKDLNNGPRLVNINKSTNIYDSNNSNIYYPPNGGGTTTTTGGTVGHEPYPEPGQQRVQNLSNSSVASFGFGKRR